MNPTQFPGIAEKSRVLSCTNDGSIESKVITYTSCVASDDVMNLAVDLKSGVVTIPDHGFYEISLTGAMKTFAGKRIWVTLVKKSGETDGKRSEVLFISFSLSTSGTYRS